MGKRYLNSECDRSFRPAEPSWVDIYVGERIRIRRTLIGMPQEELSAALGVAYQQVQKYESGSNRVVASRLFDLAHVLGVPISFFFEGLQDFLSQAQDGQESESGAKLVSPEQGTDTERDDDLQSLETRKLMRAYSRITDPAVRKRVRHMVALLAGDRPE